MPFLDHCQQQLRQMTPWQIELCTLLDDVMDGSIKRLMIFASRDVEKTKIIFDLFIPYLIQETDWMVLYVGLSKAVADNRLNANDFTISRRVVCAHLGSTLTGRRDFDLGIVDGWDTGNLHMAANRAYEWYAREFLRKLTSSATIIYVGREREGVARLIHESDYWSIVDGQGYADAE